MLVTTPKTGAAAKAMAKPLKRGKACMNCRFLKIKCDGVKPICGPCDRHPKDDPCEYSDGPGRSRTKVLEETVSRLEARLYELENPDASTPSVTLHDPYSPYNERLTRSSPTLLIPEAQRMTPLAPFSPTSTSSSLPSGRTWASFGALDQRSDSTRSSGSSSSPRRQHSGSPVLGTEEPPFAVIQNLIDGFLPHSLQFGFFLNPKRFREDALQPVTFGHYSRPSPSLLSAVYLWGAHLSKSDRLLSQEHAFLCRAVRHIATDTLSSHPHAILHTLQATVLVSYYFLRVGRFLEAKLHANSAVSLAVGAGLHKIRATSPPPFALGISADSAIFLHQPRDNIEEGERVSGFWAVVTLHKYITVALEPPTSVCGTLEAPGMQIDTPWPMDASEYEEGLFSPEIQGSNTIRTFLAQAVESGYQGTSSAAKNVKAAILFHRSAQLIGQWTPRLRPDEFQSFSASFQSIQRLIEHLKATLPPLAHLAHMNLNDSDTKTILLTHALADGALIKLHTSFAYAYTSSQQVCLTAARNIVDLGGIELQHLGQVNPIMGTLWAIACTVLIDEISRSRTTPTHTSPTGAWPAGGTSEGDEEELLEKLKRGMDALSSISDESAYARYQHNKIQEAYSNI